MKDVLALKEQQDNLVQAWRAQVESVETVSQGRAIVVFTVVTIIFLPLSFLASVFGMNASELSSDNNLSLVDEFKYMCESGVSSKSSRPLVPPCSCADNFPTCLYSPHLSRRESPGHHPRLQPHDAHGGLRRVAWLENSIRESAGRRGSLQGAAKLGRRGPGSRRRRSERHRAGEEEEEASAARRRIFVPRGKRKPTQLRRTLRRRDGRGAVWWQDEQHDGSLWDPGITGPRRAGAGY